MHNLTGVELLMVMEDKPDGYDIVLPLGSPSKLAPTKKGRRKLP
jgi:hypothetical protein